MGNLESQLVGKGRHGAIPTSIVGDGMPGDGVCNVAVCWLPFLAQYMADGTREDAM